MSAWADVFLGVIAVATLVMAVVQVLVISQAARLGKQVERLARQVEEEIRPLLANLAALFTRRHAGLLARPRPDRAGRPPRG